MELQLEKKIEKCKLSPTIKFSLRKRGERLWACMCHFHCAEVETIEKREIVTCSIQQQQQPISIHPYASLARSLKRVGKKEKRGKTHSLTKHGKSQTLNNPRQRNRSWKWESESQEMTKLPRQPESSTKQPTNQLLVKSSRAYQFKKVRTPPPPSPALQPEPHSPCQSHSRTSPVSSPQSTSNTPSTPISER